jgi:uncharacterized membrane protein YGL010W
VLIPILYGPDYEPSVYFALVLILAKLNYSIVKLFGSYAAISNRYLIQIKLNALYIILYLTLFLLMKKLNFQLSWECAAVFASFVTVLAGISLTRRSSSVQSYDSSINSPLGDSNF